MNLLICAATEVEIRPLTDFLRKNATTLSDNRFRYNTHTATILITGVGGVATAYALGKILQHRSFDLVIQAGIAGAFSPKVEIGSVWQVSEDRFADLGAETREGFAGLFDLRLQQPDDMPFENGLLKAVKPSRSSLSLLPSLSAISVNCVSGSAPTISMRIEKYRPGLESMEGAAFFYVCRLENIPCIQVRSVSNHVEVRDTSKWNIGTAIRNLNDTLIHFFKEDLK